MGLYTLISSLSLYNREMTALIIQYLGTSSPLAIAFLTPDGEMSVQSPDAQAKLFFTRLLNLAITSNPTLSQIADKLLVDKTTRLQLPWADPDYISALAHYLNSQQLQYNGTKIRAFANPMFTRHLDEISSVGAISGLHEEDLDTDHHH